MLDFLKKADELLAKILRAFVVAMCCVIGIVLIVRVILRFTPIHFSMSWSDEVVEWSMAYMIFVTSGLIMRDGDHFKVDLLQERFKDAYWIHILNFLIALFCLGFFSVFLFYAWQLFDGAIMTSSVLKFPMKVAYFSILFGGVLLVIYSLRDVCVQGYGLIKGNKKAE